MTLQEAISLFKNKRILVVGDLMLDHYTIGEATRLSAEAPVPVVRKIEEEFRLGGAANVAYNIVSLGARCSLAGTVGADFAGEMLLRLLAKSGVETGIILEYGAKPTTVKHRISAGNHQLLRLDTEEYGHLSPEAESEFLSRLAPEIQKADAIVLSDYAKGLFTKRVADYIKEKAKEHKKAILADIKPSNKHFFVGVQVITPNLNEGRDMTGGVTLDEIGKKLVKELKTEVVLTRGGEGMSVFSSEEQVKHIPAYTSNAVDVTGAGDTVIAVMSLGCAVGLSLVQAAELANTAGGIVVQKKGTAPVLAEELSSEVGAGRQTTYPVREA